MKLGTIALDYDGTIATHGVMHPEMRSAIGAARDAGIAVILATGRRLDDLKRVAGDLGCFDVIVAENGAVLDFPQRRRHVLLGHPPAPVGRLFQGDQDLVLWQIEPGALQIGFQTLVQACRSEQVSPPDLLLI